MTQFREHYSRLHDEALIDLALRGGLSEEAESDLLAELHDRGIKDLSAYRAQREREAQSEEQHRQTRLAARAKAVRWRTQLLLALGFAACCYGAFRLALPNRSDPGDDGGLMLVLGLAVLVFAVVSARISHWWSERVLLRKPGP